MSVYYDELRWEGYTIHFVRLFYGLFLEILGFFLVYSVFQNVPEITHTDADFKSYFQ
jgi:hypothetical protein